MAESAGKLVLNIIKKSCSATSCPYRYGDGAGNLPNQVDEKLKYRVADGNEVRALKRRLKELEAAVQRALDAAEKNRKMNVEEISHLKGVLQKKPITQG
jgi:hypothetical protein